MAINFSEKNIQVWVEWYHKANKLRKFYRNVLPANEVLFKAGMEKAHLFFIKECKKKIYDNSL